MQSPACLPLPVDLSTHTLGWQMAAVSHKEAGIAAGQTQASLETHHGGGVGWAQSTPRSGGHPASEPRDGVGTGRWQILKPQLCHTWQRVGP